MKHLFLVIGLFLSCLASVPAQVFVDVASTHGINEAFGIGSSGAAASFVDINGDGLDDISLPSQIGDSIHIFLNTGGSFQKIPAPVVELDESKMLLWADLDNDGDMDLFVPNHGAQNRLYENQGGLSFVDITASAGIFLESADSFGSAFGDYDRDGYLDLYVCNYSETDSNHLYRNNGNLTFTEVSVPAGINQPPNLSFQATFLDYNNDGWPDIFVAIDKDWTNLLLENNRDGTFTDVSMAAGVDMAIDAMNAGFGDTNNDGLLDIYVTNGPPGNLMHMNNGDGTFNESAVTCGTALNMNSWGGNFFDCDNDGLTDLYVNSDHFGSVNNALFVNQDSCVFVKHNGPYSGNAPWSFGNAYGDFDNDGQLDLVVNQAYGQPYLLLRNQSAPTTNHWIKVHLTGTISNRDGVGSWVRVHAGGKMQAQFTNTGTAYLAQNTHNTHFGLDTIGTVDSIVVAWPSGFVSKLYNPAVDTTILVEETVISWEGTVDTNWNTAANWSSGIVPSVEDNVVIPPGAPSYPVLLNGTLEIGANVLGADYLCRGLFIQSGAEVHCMPAASIVNSGFLRVAGVLNVENISLVNHPGSNLVIDPSGALNVQN